MLLDAYEIIDKGIVVAIDDEKKRRKVRLACRNGCDNCCRTHKDIPVYPHEMVGLYWFGAEKTAGAFRGILRRQLSSHREGDACPFLANGSCSVHPLRPAACRQFNVFNISCTEGEDPYFTRRDDVLTPIQGYINRAFSIMLPFYGITDSSNQGMAVHNIIHTQAVNLQTYDWEKLVSVMDKLDSGKGQNNSPNPS